MAGLYVAIVLAALFSLWEPSRFETIVNLRVIASSQAITGIVALGLIVALIAGMFDVSIAANMTLSLILVAWLQSHEHLNPIIAVILTILVGALIGAVNAIVITRLHVPAVIATLGMSSILEAIAYWVAGGESIVNGISPTFKSFGQAKVVGIPVPVLYLAGLALILWYLLEHTPRGRYLYAIGSNPQASRLAGLPVVRLQWFAAITSGVLASCAGVLLTAQVGAGDFGSGDSYLLPAFAVAFLGSTQIRPGRFNVVGTLVALYLLAIGVQGLELHYPSLPWIADLFEGIALIIAVAIGTRSGKSQGVDVI
jgi:ribose transport system permease protein